MIKKVLPVAILCFVLVSCEKTPLEKPEETIDDTEITEDAGSEESGSEAPTTDGGDSNNEPPTIETGTPTPDPEPEPTTTPPLSTPQKQLSVWHWGHDDKAYGINQVIVDDKKSKTVIDHYLVNKVTRVYGGYSKIPAHPTMKASLAKWNAKLKAAGIKSIYLIGNAQWIYQENRKDLINYINTYYVNFNKSVDKDSRLQGLHLDIEPHQLSEWKTASMQRKRELLMLLNETYMDIRILLDGHGMTDDEIMADIPTWFDESSAIGWRSDADRDLWFKNARKHLDGFTIMAYELNSVPTIIKRTDWERANFNGTIEIGLDSDEIGTVWSSKSQMINSLNQIQSSTSAPIAFHNYVTFMER